MLKDLTKGCCSVTLDRSRLLFGAAAGSLLALLLAAGGKPALAQSADAQERCTGDVMRLCSEFVPDADAIVICLKARRLQLTASCLGALAPEPPEPIALQVPPTKKVKKTRHSVASVAPARPAKLRPQRAAAR